MKMLLRPEECVKILENLLGIQQNQYELVNYNVESDKCAVGYLGDYYKLTLCYCTAGSKLRQHHELFVKALPVQSDEAAKGDIFRKEGWLYEKLLPQMQQYSNIKWSPKCFYSRADLVVLENIKLLGYASAGGALLREEQLQQLLRSLAAFHAASLIYEQRSGINIGRDFAEHLTEITVSADIAWYTTGLSAIMDVLKTLPQYQSHPRRDFMDSHLTEILERVYALVDPSAKYRNVLCHRDLWAGNIFFPPNNKDAVVLIDYQTCRYTPPAIDLSFSFYLTLNGAERRRLEAKNIDFYYNLLRQDLKEFDLQVDELITKEELLTSYEECRLFGAVYSAVAATIVKVPPSLVTNDFKYVDRSAVLLNHMQENSEFKRVMEEHCLEVMEIALSQTEES